MVDDLFDEFLEYDFTMGADVVICPYCGGEVACSLFFDDEVECPKCGRKFRKEEAARSLFLFLLEDVYDS